MKRPLFVIAGGFVLGEVLGLHERYAVLMFMAVMILTVTMWFIKKAGNGPFWGLLLFFVISGFWRGSAEKAVCAREAALMYDGVRAEVCGRITRIRGTQKGVELLIRPEKGTSGERDLRYLLVYLNTEEPDKCPDLSIGIKVLARGKYSLFGSATNPGQFDYSAYYRAQKLTYRFFADDIEILSRRQSLYDKFRDSYRRLSANFATILDLCADERDAGILRSLILGDRTGLDAQVRDLYQKNGIAHLLAISGLHLSLISAAVYGILKRAGMGFGCAGALGGMVLLAYCVMSGASVSSLRALIMVLLSYLAAWKGRTYDLLTALGTAALILFCDSPYQLTQSGPLLSFLAILGIAAVSGTDARSGRLMNLLRPSLGLQLATAPVILWYFFRFPLYGVIINLFVLPLTGFVAASGAAGILTGMVNLTLGRFFLGAAHYILLWYDLLCGFFGMLPFSSLLTGRPKAVQVCIYYAALAVLWFWDRDHERTDARKILRMLPLILLLFPVPVLNCNVLFMDVGQGDGILIRSEAGVILIDGGSSSVNDLYAERLEPCLESLAVSKIDYAIVSHSHSDHISGLSELLTPESPVHVKNLIIPAAGRGDETYDCLIDRAQKAGTSLFRMKTGDEVEFGKMRFSCLYPGDSNGFPAGDANEHSLVLRFDYGDFSMLSGGDMTADGEKAILSDASLAGALSGIQVLKVAHHGSSTSSSGPWLDAISPSWAVISYGKNNVYGHPAGETVSALKERNIKIYETARDGAVSLSTDGRRIRWKTFITGDAPD